MDLTANPEGPFRECDLRKYDLIVIRAEKITSADALHVRIVKMKATNFIASSASPQVVRYLCI
jgi:hypothetical protein